MGGYITLAFAKAFPQYLLVLVYYILLHLQIVKKKQNRLRSIEIIEQYGGYAFLKLRFRIYLEQTSKQHQRSCRKFNRSF
jgi:hypothetical protein